MRSCKPPQRGCTVCHAAASRCCLRLSHVCLVTTPPHKPAPRSPSCCQGGCRSNSIYAPGGSVYARCHPWQPSELRMCNDPCPLVPEEDGALFKMMHGARARGTGRFVLCMAAGESQRSTPVSETWSAAQHTLSAASATSTARALSMAPKPPNCLRL